MKLSSSLRTKFMVSFAVPIVMLLLIASIGYLTSDSVRSRFVEVADTNLPLVTAFEDVKYAGSRLISSTNEFVLDELLTEQGIGEEEEGEEGDDGEAAEITEAIEAYHAAIAQIRTLEGNDAEDLDALADIETSGQALIDTANQLVEMQEEGESIEEIAEAREAFEDLEEDFILAIDEALEHEREELLEGRDDVNDAVTLVGRVEIGLGLLALVVMMAGNFYGFTSIARPIDRLRAAAEGLRAGDMSQRVPIETSDEIGQLGEIFNEMAAMIEMLVSDLKAQVTEAEEARDRAERSDQVKSAFLASMSHELRTPLNAVINFTKFVAQGDLGPVNEEQKETLYESIDSARHLLNLINDVLDMSKIESGSLNLFIQDDIDVREMLTSVASTGRGLLADKDVEIRTAIPEFVPPIRADKQRIRQIFLNVVSNACKFTDEGFIELRLDCVDDEIIVAIKDTGPGIAAEDHDLVFEAFKQTSSGLRQGGGTGLGMPISKNLVEVHGGRIWLESEVGEGATFYIALPIKSEELVPMALS